MKNNKIKKIFISLVAVTGMIIFLVAVFIFRYNKMVDAINNYEIADIDLGVIRDGIYHGKYGEFLVGVTLNVTVKNHKIVDIRIVEQRAGKGYEARDTIDRVMEAQSLKVDAITGATGSSKCILIAIERALTGQ